MDKVDEQILAFINDDQELKQKYDLMLTVKGVGKVLAAMSLVYTSISLMHYKGAL